jgi:hypothetical protein
MVDPVKRASENEILLSSAKAPFCHKGSMTKDEDVLYFCAVLHKKKLRQTSALPALESSEELTADLITKPAVQVVPAFTLFGL